MVVGGVNRWPLCCADLKMKRYLSVCCSGTTLKRVIDVFLVDAVKCYLGVDTRVVLLSTSIAPGYILQLILTRVILREKKRNITLTLKTFVNEYLIMTCHGN